MLSLYAILDFLFILQLLSKVPRKASSMTKTSIAILMFLVVLCNLSAQSNAYSWEDFVQEYIGNANIDADITEDYVQNSMENLLEIHQNPIEINEISREQLLMLPFLSTQHADSILSYIHRYGPILSLQELQFVPRINRKIRDYLSLFVFCREKTGQLPAVQPKYRQNFHHTVIANSSIPLYERDGFKHYTAEQLSQSPNKNYKGLPFSASLRYRGKWKDKMEWGMTVQNDEGEPYGSYGNRFFDYQSFYLSGKGKGLLQKWVVGDYKLRIGMGLTMGYGFLNSPFNLIPFSNNTTQRIVCHSSTEEIRFLRGGVATFGNRNIRLTLFGSYRSLDATIKENLVSTLLTSGLHRTKSELDRKGILHSLTAGGTLDWNLRQFSLGASVVQTRYDKAFTPGNALYRKYYMEGKDFGNYGIHYQYNNSNMCVNGEGSIDQKGGWAAVTKFNFSPRYGLHYVFLHRYYDKAYNAPHAFAYSSGGHVRNEHGVCGCIDWTIKDKWNLKSYIDFARHQFATYKASQPSHRTLFLGQISYQLSNDMSFSLRYKFRESQEDNSKHTALVSVYKNSWQLQSHYTLGMVKNVTSLDFIYRLPAQGNPEWGRMLSHRASVKIKRFGFYAVGAWFHTPNYYTSLYLYENSPTYSFSYPLCYYHGLRGMVMVSGDICRRFSITFKYGITYYSNKKYISSAQQRIPYPYKNDLYLQFIWKY